MQRVEAREPNYSQEVWGEERKINLSYLQRISRFPEGYQDILEKEGVPPPVKGPLKIRLNRSEMLKKTWKENVSGKTDEFGNRSGRPSTAPAKPETQPPESANVYMTKAEKLRREYIKVMAQGGGQRTWNATHAVSNRDPLDIAKSTSQTEGDEEANEVNGDKNKSSRSRSASPRRIKIRMNRAQLLRLEEQEARKVIAEPIRQPVLFQNVEAKVDFGKDGWHEDNARATQAAEKDRETQLDMWNIDESEFEPESTLPPDQAEKVEASWIQIITGAALWEGFRLPEKNRSSVRIYWSSDPNECWFERNELIQNVVPRVREIALEMGIEFLIQDLKWGVSRSLQDSQLHDYICIDELHNFIKVIYIYIYI
jgi:hypothetical protein